MELRNLWAKNKLKSLQCQVKSSSRSYASVLGGGQMSFWKNLCGIQADLSNQKNSYGMTSTSPPVTEALQVKDGTRKNREAILAEEMDQRIGLLDYWMGGVMGSKCCCHQSNTPALHSSSS